MLKIQPSEIATLIRRARRSSHRTLKSVAAEAGVALATVQRYEMHPNPAAARIVSVLSALGYDLTPRNGEVRLPLAQADALRRLLHEVRQVAAGGRAELRVILALEEVNTTRAGAALIRAHHDWQKANSSDRPAAS